MITPVPRTVSSVLIEEDGNSVTITWGLGEPIQTDQVEYFGYGVYYYDPRGNGGKRFGMRFGKERTAWIFDNDSSTQANYEAGCISISADAIVVHYRDASLGMAQVGTIAAYAHVDGGDVQDQIPVSVLR